MPSTGGALFSELPSREELDIPPEHMASKVVALKQTCRLNSHRTATVVVCSLQDFKPSENIEPKSPTDTVGRATQE